MALPRPILIASTLSIQTKATCLRDALNNAVLMKALRLFGKTRMWLFKEVNSAEFGTEFKNYCVQRGERGLFLAKKALPIDITP